MALIVGAAVIGGIVFAGAQGGGTEVLATSRALRLGDTIGASDLTSVQIKVTGASAATIPASQRSTILRERVTGPLAAGTLLSPSSVSKGPQLGPGEVGLALALDPDRAAQGILAAGQTVLIVGQQTQAGSQQTIPLAAAARVLSIGPGSATTGKVIVDLALTNPPDATAVSAAASSTGGVRLVVVAGASGG